MNINILKCGLISAALVAGAMSIFSGCTESSSDPYVIPTSSSYVPPASSAYVPRDTVTLFSPIRFTDLSATANGEQNTFTFSGSAFLDGWDTLANVNSLNDPQFTDIIFDLALVDPATGTVSETQLTPFLTYDKGVFPRSNINLVEMGVKLYDPYKTECGMFRLYLYAYATNDTIGTASYDSKRFVSIDSLDFFRDESKCVEEQLVSSSSEAAIPKVELVRGEGSFSTANGFSFTTGTEVPAAEADITITVTETEELILQGHNGFRVTDYINDLDQNYDDDWDSKKLLPPDPAHMSDFRFKQVSLAEEFEGFDNFRFYIAVGPNYNPETGDDFYALTLKEKSTVDASGHLKATIIYYKKLQ